MTTDRLTVARKSGTSEKDLQLLTAQAARQRAEETEAADGFEDKLVRLKALRLARDAAASSVEAPARKSPARKNPARKPAL